MNPRQTAGTLTRAADYVEAHGWRRGSIRGPDGSVCAIGAIRAVSAPGPARQTSPEERAARTALAQYLELRPDPNDPSPLAANPSCLVTAWNDQVETAGEVITAMRNTAKHLTGGA
ncbi:hypothetical protein [Streptomyces sp. ME19-01-6]|uniref:DUF6197 family protein n=1 Tax=Streptomyces sp. ME19-01-6 TaxID=3028686 RepID=UPI0029A62069|nr:hypothetical protein [Streptomyces sp. ME19-01-6]MDX3232960.1 hypothetical protein [Streptomyces sp. ME19-01-6]